MVAFRILNWEDIDSKNSRQILTRGKHTLSTWIKMWALTSSSVFPMHRDIDDIFCDHEFLKFENVWRICSRNCESDFAEVENDYNDKYVT